MNYMCIRLPRLIKDLLSFRSKVCPEAQFFDKGDGSYGG